MVTNKANQYPEEQDGVRLVGEVEYFVSTETSTTQGTFKLTRNMLDDLWKLKAQSERIGQPRTPIHNPYLLSLPAILDANKYEEDAQKENRQKEEAQEKKKRRKKRKVKRMPAIDVDAIPVIPILIFAAYVLGMVQIALQCGR